MIYNTQNPDNDLLEKYAEDGEHLVDSSVERFNEISAKPVGADIVADKIYETSVKDIIKRTLIRHDAVKVSAIIQDIYKTAN